jgi:hypothetical protein
LKDRAGGYCLKSKHRPHAKITDKTLFLIFEPSLSLCSLCEPFGNYFPSPKNGDCHWSYALQAKCLSRQAQRKAHKPQRLASKPLRLAIFAFRLGSPSQTFDAPYLNFAQNGAKFPIFWLNLMFYSVALTLQ